MRYAMTITALASGVALLAATQLPVKASPTFDLKSSTSMLQLVKSGGGGGMGGGGGGGGGGRLNLGELFEPLDIALKEAHVRPREAEASHVPIAMSFRCGELLVGHVHADHLAIRADELCDHVDVAARA